MVLLGHLQGSCNSRAQSPTGWQQRRYTPQAGSPRANPAPGAHPARSAGSSVAGSSVAAPCDSGHFVSAASGPRKPSQLHLDVGSYALPGMKPGFADQVNQDVCLVLPIGSGRQLLVAVFDGHGKYGLEAATRASEMFAQAAPSFASATPEQLPAALGRVFGIAQSIFEQEEFAKSSGTTATAAVINTDTRSVTCAHVGDSALVIASGSKVDFETEDHDFDAGDAARCLARGGEVREFQTVLKPVRRIYAKGADYPALALARSLGDLDAHVYGVLAEPSVRDSVPFEEGNILIAASDGVWNAMSKATAVQIALAGSAEAAAQAIVFEAQGRWPKGDYVDDIAAVVVKAYPSNGGRNISAPCPQPSSESAIVGTTAAPVPAPRVMQPFLQTQGGRASSPSHYVVSGSGSAVPTSYGTASSVSRRVFAAALSPRPQPHQNLQSIGAAFPAGRAAGRFASPRPTHRCVSPGSPARCSSPNPHYRPGASSPALASRILRR